MNADGLSETQMQMIARELNNSETAFWLQPDNDDCDGIIRYFSPTVEVPICGHATIAAMFAKAVTEELSNCVLRIKTRVGILPFEIVKNEGSIKVWMTQGAVEIQDALPLDIVNEIVRGLRITSDQLNPDCPVQIASTGHSKVMIGIKSRETLNRLNPDFSQLTAVSEKVRSNGFYVFTFDSPGPQILTHGRMFAPIIGINEDPVTGNANGPLGAYLIHNRIKQAGDSGLFEFKSVQGEAIGREGLVEVAVTVENDTPVLVRIGGEAVTVFETNLKM